MYEVPAAWGKSELVTYQMLAEVRGCMEGWLVSDCLC